MSPESLLHLWFNTGDRRLYFAVVKKAIKIPGYVRHPVTNQEYVPAAELREAKKGEQLTVRFDLTRPSLIEVEYNEVVFRMNQLQWSNIAGDVAFVG